jgi:hypothetical protein
MSSTRITDCPKHLSLAGRVTRLGEFSPIGSVFFIFGQFNEIYAIRPKFGCYSIFFYSICYSIFTKYGFGYILGDFFTNESGHPARLLR